MVIGIACGGPVIGYIAEMMRREREQQKPTVRQRVAPPKALAPPKPHGPVPRKRWKRG